MKTRSKFGGFEIEAAKRVWLLLTCIRYREVLVLQGAPAMGLLFSMGAPTIHKIAMGAIFIAANILLLAHIWSLNDWADIQSDRADRNKSARVFTAKNIDFSLMLCFSIALLFSSLGLFALLPVRTFVIAICIAMLGFIYSFPGIRAKGIVLLSSVVHLVGGLLHFVLGYSVFASIDPNVISPAFFFALIFTAGHGVQEVQDYDADLLAGTRTNAVVFGKLPVFCASNAVFCFAYVYLAYLSWAGIFPTRLGPLSLALCALHLYWVRHMLLSELSFESVHQFRRQYRTMFVLIGLNVSSTLIW